MVSVKCGRSYSVLFGLVLISWLMVLLFKLRNRLGGVDVRSIPANERIDNYSVLVRSRLPTFFFYYWVEGGGRGGRRRRRRRKEGESPDDSHSRFRIYTECRGMNNWTEKSLVENCPCCALEPVDGWNCYFREKEAKKANPCSSQRGGRRGQFVNGLGRVDMPYNGWINTICTRPDFFFFLLLFFFCIFFFLFPCCWNDLKWEKGVDPENGRRRRRRKSSSFSGRSSGDLCPQERKTEQEEKKMKMKKRKSRCGWMMEVSKWRRNLNQKCPPVWPVLFTFSYTLAPEPGGRGFLLPLPPPPPPPSPPSTSSSSVLPASAIRRDPDYLTWKIWRMDWNGNDCRWCRWIGFNYVLLWWIHESGRGGRQRRMGPGWFSSARRIDPVDQAQVVDVCGKKPNQNKYKTAV